MSSMPVSGQVKAGRFISASRSVPVLGMNVEVQASALNLLLQYGPLACDDTEATETSLLRAELLAFIRGVVKGRPNMG